MRILARAHECLRNRFPKPDQALDVYGKAISLDAKPSEAHWWRCYSLNTLGKFTAAISACDTALKLNPNYAEVLWSKGCTRDRQAQDQEALILYQRTTTLKPDLAEAWNNKGTALLQLNRPTVKTVLNG